MHSIPSESLGKSCYCFVEASALMDPSSTDGRQFKLQVFHPRRASEVRTGLSAAPPPRVIVPPAMQNSRRSGTRWGRFAAAVAPLSSGWRVSDKEQTHNESLLIERWRRRGRIINGRYWLYWYYQLG